MYDPDIDTTWTELNKVADERDDLDKRMKFAIESARRNERSWIEIAETLRLPSEDAAKALYQRLSNEAVGIYAD